MLVGSGLKDIQGMSGSKLAEDLTQPPTIQALVKCGEGGVNFIDGEVFDYIRRSFGNRGGGGQQASHEDANSRQEEVHVERETVSTRITQGYNLREKSRRRKCVWCSRL